MSFTFLRYKSTYSWAFEPAHEQVYYFKVFQSCYHISCFILSKTSQWCSPLGVEEH